MALRLWQVEVWHRVPFMLPVMMLLLLDVILRNIAGKRQRDVFNELVQCVKEWLPLYHSCWYCSYEFWRWMISSKPIQRCTQNGCSMPRIHDFYVLYERGYLQYPCVTNIETGGLSYIVSTNKSGRKAMKQIRNWRERGLQLCEWAICWCCCSFWLLFTLFLCIWHARCFCPGHFKRTRHESWR